MKHPLAHSVAKIISTSGHHDFEKTALELFRFQAEQNAPYRRYLSALGISPECITDWQDIPAIPTRAFKLPAHPLTCFPDTEPAARFLTSGTTSEQKGEHLFPSTDLYEHALREGFTQSGLPQLPKIHFLAPSPLELPHSSLSHMFGTLAQPDSCYLIKDGRFSLAALYQAKEPIFLMGTALAFLHLMENHQPHPLPLGSHLLETGGYKGTSRTLEKADFYQQLSAHFNLPDHHLHNEYGMTELSTQAYATGSDGAHRFPHWCRANLICPHTGKEPTIGKPGYLRFFDLANAYTISAIQTQDFAVMNPDGSFHLIGRDPSALPRGCSRSIDDQLNS